MRNFFQNVPDLIRAHYTENVNERFMAKLDNNNNNVKVSI